MESQWTQQCVRDWKSESITILRRHAFRRPIKGERFKTRCIEQQRAHLPTKWINENYLVKKEREITHTYLVGYLLKCLVISFVCLFFIFDNFTHINKYSLIDIHMCALANNTVRNASKAHVKKHTNERKIMSRKINSTEICKFVKNCTMKRFNSIGSDSI